MIGPHLWRIVVATSAALDPDEDVSAKKLAIEVRLKEAKKASTKALEAQSVAAAEVEERSVTIRDYP